MNQPHIVIFDDHCLLCNKAVKFIIKRDPKALFAFTGMQSLLAKKLREKYQLTALKDDTIILIKEGKAYLKSDAALEIVKSFSPLWRLLLITKIFPRYIRDLGYDLIATNRYKLFGRSDTCLLPSSELQNRFIDDDKF